MRRWLEEAGVVLVLCGGGGASEGRGGAGGGVCSGGRGGAGGGVGGSSLSPVPFSTTGEASAGSSNNTDPCSEKENTIILLSNPVKVDQEPRDIIVTSTL